MFCFIETGSHSVGQENFYSLYNSGFPWIYGNPPALASKYWTCRSKMSCPARKKTFLGMVCIFFNVCKHFGNVSHLPFYNSLSFFPQPFMSLVTVLIIICKVLLFRFSNISIFFFVVYGFSFGFMLMWGLHALCI